MRAGAKKGTTYVGISMLAVFFFVFLGTEYLFDNCMVAVTDAAGVVRAQNEVLGISAIGFLLYGWLSDFLADKKRWILAALGFLAFGISAGCMVCILQRGGYAQMLAAGCVLFLLLGVFGAGIHYQMAYALENRAMLARCVGFAYAGGILLQFLNNNLIEKANMQAVALCCGCVLLVLMLLQQAKKQHDETDSEASGKEKQTEIRYPGYMGWLLVGIVFFLTIIFATLDNTVTSVHAAGTVDIGQWPRLLLAVSGIAAGFLYDIRNRRWMHMMMYCVALLSTICVIVIGFGGPFLLGLLVFYLSAGFFSVYFTVAFMDIAYHSARRKLWAGLGRAVNNVCALVTTAFAGVIASAGYGVMIVAVILFVVISALIFTYQNLLYVVQVDGNVELAAGEQRKTGVDGDTDRSDTMDGASEHKPVIDKFAVFSEQYALTNREREVLQALLSSDENVQDIAHALGISRAAIYRHISNMNEKTATKARMGLIQFYYGWNPEK